MEPHDEASVLSTIKKEKNRRQRKATGRKITQKVCNQAVLLKKKHQKNCEENNSLILLAEDY